MVMGARAGLLLASVILTVISVMLSTGQWDVVSTAAGSYSEFLPFVTKGYQSPSPPPDSPSFALIADNSASFPNSQVPQYEKFEITFQLTNTVASNPQFPYDETPPAGVDPKIGISVDAWFSQDNFQTVYQQPAFYYQKFDYQVKSGREWMYPTDNFSWKVRFAPPRAGAWQYKLAAQDASGTATTLPRSFVVIGSNDRGFIRASQRDPRYFEFEDGTYFPGLGYNVKVNWVNPTLDNQANFQEMAQNGIQLARIWLSEWSIFGSSWNPWSGLRGDYDGYIPRTGLTQFTGPGGQISMKIKLGYAEDSSGNKNTGWFEACRFIGDTGASPPAIKQNTLYHFRIKYWAFDISGPRDARYPNYGFVTKIQNPLDGNWHTNCYEPGTNNSTGQVISSYAKNGTGWSYLEGDWNFGTRDFLPNFYLALENVNAKDPTSGKGPAVYIDTVEIREKLPDGSLGPNIVAKPSMEHDLYFEQRNSYAFDRALDLAKQYGIYLKPVIMEKDDDILNSIDYTGNFTIAASNNLFYGNYRQVTKVRWLQQAWWRYLQARWGYSTNIHSWELLNEGDPYNDRHYTLADEFAKYMHQFVPNNHLVTTSFWHSFPRTDFWANPSYPNIDYADIHRYIPKDTDPTLFSDSALATQSLSGQIGAKTSGGAGKPTVRGETGFTDSLGTGPTTALANDATGIWLHKFVWAGINAGGLMESYFYYREHIYNGLFDFRSIFGTYYSFIRDVPLSNGNYTDLGATVSNGQVRVLGQKDTVNGKAHLWVDNRTHTWNNVVSNPSAVVPQTGNITFSGMPPGTYTISWYDTYAGSISRTEAKTVDSSGIVSLDVANLGTDVAIKVAK